MAVHPIGEEYSIAEWCAVGSEKYRCACVVAAEVALAKAEAAQGVIPPEAAAGIEEHAPEASRERAKAIKPGISHDMMASVNGGLKFPIPMNMFTHQRGVGYPCMYQVCTGDCPIRAGVLHNSSIERLPDETTCR
jgi:hypothetical protein